MSPAKDAKHHEFTIIVNSREKKVTQKELGYWDVIQLAFPGKPGPGISYTVSYEKGRSGQGGTLAAGSDPVHVHEGMVFDVKRTNKS